MGKKTNNKRKAVQDPLATSLTQRMGETPPPDSRPLTPTPPPLPLVPQEQYDALVDEYNGFRAQVAKQQALYKDPTMVLMVAMSLLDPDSTVHATEDHSSLLHMLARKLDDLGFSPPRPPPPATPPRSLATCGTQTVPNPPVLCATHATQTSDPTCGKTYASAATSTAPVTPLGPSGLKMTHTRGKTYASAATTNTQSTPPGPSGPKSNPPPKNPPLKTPPPASGKSVRRKVTLAPHVVASESSYSFVITWPRPPPVAAREEISHAVIVALSCLGEFRTSGIRWTRAGNLGISLLTGEQAIPLTAKRMQKLLIEPGLANTLSKDSVGAPDHGSFANFQVLQDGPWDELVVHGVRPAVANFDNISTALGASADLILVKNLIKTDHSPDAPRLVKIALPTGTPATAHYLVHGLNVGGFSCRVSKYQPRKPTAPSRSPPPQ
jgi:hypothetical protein